MLLISSSSLIVLVTRPARGREGERERVIIFHSSDQKSNPIEQEAKRKLLENAAFCSCCVYNPLRIGDTKSRLRLLPDFCLAPFSLLLLYFFFFSFSKILFLRLDWKIIFRVILTYHRGLSLLYTSVSLPPKGFMQLSAAT